ncbi:hypothetical protein N7456_007123 [Penicillium angulare]|uniref:Kinesin light chain n=1 Tax=Penicillium angulare TaxID=116970 RepID=A0A9W9KCT9_9EURO|nr:hypothetical protein N7456_007123 [Penicillium angulare]
MVDDLRGPLRETAGSLAAQDWILTDGGNPQSCSYFIPGYTQSTNDWDCRPKDCEEFIAYDWAAGAASGNEEEYKSFSALRAMNDFALKLLDQGQWVDAEKLQVKVAELNRNALGEEHPDTLTSLANLASMLSRQGRWAEAETLSLRVLGARQKIFGAEHPATLTSTGNLAYIYCWQDRWADAEALELDRLEATKKSLGPDDPQTLATMDDLGFIRRKLYRKGLGFKTYRA